jgi:TrmH family RNA methyltransferase
MKGESIYKTTLENKGFVVIGNEANGISPTVAKMVTTKLSIPSFGKAESLNAAIATGVVLSEFKRLA